MNIYTVGFAFRGLGFDDVLLVRKKKPAFMAGQLNGIGGLVEDGESPITAQRREFEEETGRFVMQWNLFAVLQRPRAKVYVFSAFLHMGLGKVHSQNDVGEEILWVKSWRCQPLNYFASVPMLMQLAILRPLAPVHITLGDVLPVTKEKPDKESADAPK